MARPMKWFTRSFRHTALASAGQARIELLSPLPVGDVKNSTVTRLIVHLEGLGDTVNTVKVASWGITFVNDDAAVAVAYPDVDDETERVDWLVRGQLVIPSGADLRDRPLPSVHYDGRSARVCRAEKDRLFLLVDLDSTDTGGVFLHGVVRVLVRLP